KCDKECPMNIQISQKEKISDLQCISCYECTSERQCPVTDTINLKTISIVNNQQLKISNSYPDNKEAVE
ncbi:MAG: hypothetical protein K0S18_2303, partial [Anaerocolumna sp.]|nr:hypothetical protein [Anaerocolumna sp.]